MIKCEATCKPWTNYQGKPIEQQCSCNASVKICGTNLCLIHAGAIAIRKLVSMGLAEQLPRIYNQKGICDMGKH